MWVCLGDGRWWISVLFDLEWVMCNNMGSVVVVKVCLMVLFFLEVTVFGGCVSGLACFSNKKVMDLAMTFSGTLFLSIAMIDVIP